MEKPTRLKTISRTQVLTDGSRVLMELERNDGASMELELDIPGQVGDVVAHLLKVSVEAGEAADTPRAAAEGQRANALHLRTHNFGLLMSGPGQVALAFRFGTLELAFDVSSPKLLDLARDLVRVAEVAAREPKTPQ
jgi:hypothetical protein